MNALTIATVETGLDGLAPQIAALLPPDVPAARFRSVALAAIRNNPDLMRCEQQSLFNACLNAAQDGLLPDGREGAIVPRKGKAVWQPMIQGIYKRVKSSGSVAALSANVVYEGERFQVLLGDEDRIVHQRDMAKVARGREIAVYAIATLKDGSKEREVMTWEQVEAVRKASAMPNSGPWTQWADEMARKTVVRRLAKRLPVIEPADETLHRTIERVDSLYDFGTKPPERPELEHETRSETDRERVNREVPMDKPPTTTTVKLPDWKTFNKSLEIAMHDCRSMAEVDRVIARPDTQHAMANYKGPAKAALDGIIAEAIGRFGQIDAGQKPDDMREDVPPPDDDFGGWPGPDPAEMRRQREAAEA